MVCSEGDALRYNRYLRGTEFVHSLEAFRRAVPRQCHSQAYIIVADIATVNEGVLSDRDKSKQPALPTSRNVRATVSCGCYHIL